LILLIFRIDRFTQEIVTAQKDGYRQILENTKEIHNAITTLNQQNREYYSLRFSEVQNEPSGSKTIKKCPENFSISYSRRIPTRKISKNPQSVFLWDNQNLNIKRN
jgi:hypothetical protein